MNILWKLLAYLMISKLISGDMPALELIENKEMDELYCVLRNESESTAIMWEKSRIENIEVSQYHSNLFHCEIGKDEKCTKSLTTDVWQLDNSLNYNMEVVLDRRWETFRTIKTPKITFKTIDTHGISSEDFEIDLFVKVRANAFIFLCDGQTPPNSNCYWITLAGWDGKESLIRKCERGTIPSYEGVHPHGKCITKKAINYHGYSAQPTNAREWRVFTITLKDYVITVLYNNENFLNYTDPNKEIEVKYLLVASLMDSPGEWKTNNDTNVYRTGEPHFVHNFYKPTIEFGFSVRRTNAIDNVFLYLCDGDNVFNSTCYRVTFNSNGKNIVCKIEGEIPLHPCVHNNNILWKDSGKTTYWHHFSFSKIGEKFEFHQYEYKSVVEFNDTDFSVRYVFIGSEKMVYWKMHSYGVITSSQTGNISLSLFRAKHNEDVCIATFVRRTPGCNLTLSLTYNKTNILTDFPVAEVNFWEELQLRTHIDEDIDLHLNISITTDRDEAFISDIRDCNENDRILELNITGLEKETISCVAAKYPEVKVAVKKGSVKNATITVKDSFVDFTWAGNFEDRYVVFTYSLLKYGGCKDNLHPTDVITRNVTPSHFGPLLNARLYGLLPYVVYNVSLINDNNHIIATQNIQTLYREKITPEEFPLLEYRQDEFELEIHMILSDCKKIRGPLYYKIILTSLDSWNKNYNFTPIMNHVSVGLVTHNFNILGYSTYNFSFLFSRNSKFKDVLHQPLIVRTQPTAPLSINNITVYSKSSSEIWIRWKEPYPPTGQLEHYVIQYMDEENHRKDKEVSIDSKCKIWPDYLCTKIDKLSPNENYTIYVRGKNKNVHNLGNYKAPIYAVTKEDRPDPPKRYQISWKDMFMIVEWEHPDIINGPLKTIFITINEMMFSFPIGEEMSFYTTTVDATNFSARILNVTLELSNSNGTSTPLYMTVASPPKTPKTDGDNSFQIVNKNEVFLDPIRLSDLDGFSEIFILVPNYTHQHVAFNCNELQQPDLYLHKKLGQTRLTDNVQRLNITLKDRKISSKYLKVIVVVIRNSFEGLHRCTPHRFLLRLEQNAIISMGILLMVVIMLVFTATGIIAYRCATTEFGCSWIRSLRKDET